MVDPPAQIAFIKGRLPETGLFAGHTWRFAAQPFPISARQCMELESLGRVLLRFYQALDLLYRRSSEGKEPAWIADCLNKGKSREILSIQSSHIFKNEIPRVMRPDLLLTEEGFKLTELDSVPGGIGLTAWLNRVYSDLGFEVVGGREGMVEGFQSIFEKDQSVAIMVSEEASTYRPEMRWLAEQIKTFRCQVVDTAKGSFEGFDSLYRFFEMFDLPQVACAADLFRTARGGGLFLTPPPKTYLEEKAGLALFHNANLNEFWHRELGGAFQTRLGKLIPYTWIIDPAPIPPHAALPGLDITHWNQLKAFSQKQRALILKASGFSPNAWGARSVVLGSDVSKETWAEAIDQAVKRFDSSPYVLQRYHHPVSREVHYLDDGSGAAVGMLGRTRLCPYYFVTGKNEMMRARLGGILATTCPEDKKIIHGMSEAVLAPCRVVS